MSNLRITSCGQDCRWASLPPPRTKLFPWRMSAWRQERFNGLLADTFSHPFGFPQTIYLRQTTFLPVDIHISALDVVLRLLVAVGAGSLIGLDREEHGRPAGLRTTVLVCLAASASMILANLLADTTGRAPDAFVTMDVMRLPLGILTGMGFIGAGAILHKGNFVLGVTTAATLWFATVMGFCFGAGEIVFGLALLVLAMVVLWGFRSLEKFFPRRSEATIALRVTPEGPSLEKIVEALKSARYRFSTLEVKQTAAGREFRFEVARHARQAEIGPPDALGELARRPGVLEFTWTPLP